MKKAEKTKKTPRKTGKASRGILWRVLLIIAAVMIAAVLELGKHTIHGWILAAIVICGFIIIRIKILKGSPRDRHVSARFALLLWRKACSAECAVRARL